MQALTPKEVARAAEMQKAMDKGRKKKPRERGKKESTVEDWANDYAWDTYGIDHVKLNTMGHANLPDQLYWIPGGRPLLVEYKKLGKKPTKIQAHTMNGLSGLGYDIEACDSRELAKGIIDHYAAKAAATMDTKGLPASSGTLRLEARLCSNLGRPRSR
jgi:hypothetical protein